ncbi:MAG: cytochrome c maturation protein CcmE [Acidimicrobiales bacterium]
MSRYVAGGYAVTLVTLAWYAVGVLRRGAAAGPGAAAVPARATGPVTTAATPAVGPRPAPASSRRLWLAGLAIAAALGFLLWKGLDDATLYFRTADEALAQKASLGDRRFRIEGAVVAGSLQVRGDEVAFVIEENDGRVPVVHRGDPPELFRDMIPVVLEGRFEGDVYRSDRIMVKHTNQYRAANPERVTSYTAP